MMAARPLAWCLIHLTCAGLSLVLSGCRASLSVQGIPEPGTYHQTTPIRYRLSTRTYLVHVPRGYHADRAWPLVLVLHGAFSEAAQMEKRSGFSDLADQEGFVVAYPNGIGLFGLLQHWNAGHCCGLAQMDRVDDVGFLSYVVDDISQRLRIDPQRVYVAGYSNGGMLAYQFASQRSGSVAGVAVVAGSIGSSKGPGKPPYKAGPPQAPVPLVAIHGRQDRQVPFEGGRGRGSGNRRYVSVLDSVRSWARYCDCRPTPQLQKDPQNKRSILTWRDARGDPWVVLCVLDDWPHTWPAIGPQTGYFASGDGTTTRNRALRTSNPIPVQLVASAGSHESRTVNPGHGRQGFQPARVIWNFFSDPTGPIDR